jgi:hypothetical protein
MNHEWKQRRKEGVEERTKECSTEGKKDRINKKKGIP